MSCPECKGEKFYYMRKGKHISKYCDRCDRLFGWVTQTPEILANLREPPKTNPLF